MAASYLGRMSKRDSLTASKNNIIMEMYVRTADENYIMARWAHDQQLNTDFFWMAAHALEKYMKAVLLMNGKSVKGYSHGLVEMWGEVKKLGGLLLTGKLKKPADLGIRYWFDWSYTRFLEMLDNNGNPHNRYATYGHAKHIFHLHMFDRMVWLIRRMTVPLGDPVVRRPRTDGKTPTYKQILRTQPDFVFPHFGMPLEKVIGGPDSEKKRALLNLNMAFAPPDYPHEDRPEMTSAINPVLGRRIVTMLGSSRRDAAREGYQLAVWLMANTKLPGEVRQQFKDLMDASLLTHPGINVP